jgi:hypothetical protein
VVRREIEEHFEAARETALRDGSDEREAELAAVRTLGDPRIANRQYRKVLLTKSESSILRESNFEARMICSRKWLKWTMLSAPGTLLLLSAIFLAIHQAALARGVLVTGALMAVLLTAPFLPIYTAKRGRIFRAIKWVVMIGSVVLLFGRDGLNWSWLISCSFFPMLYSEWKRITIRRKLPIGQWPKQLYL